MLALGTTGEGILLSRDDMQSPAVGAAVAKELFEGASSFNLSP